MRVLVTGGSGFLGGRVAGLLLAEGFDVRLLSRKPKAGTAGTPAGAETVIGDLSDVESLARAVNDVQAVVHCAAKCGVWGPLSDYVETNAIGTANLLEMARRAGVSYFVYTSTLSVVYGQSSLEGVTEDRPYSANPMEPYAYSKTLAEREVLLANGPDLKTVALRPHLIWGPWDQNLLPRLVERARRKRLFFLSGGPYFVDAVYVDNIAQAHLIALSKLIAGDPVGGHSFFIGQDNPQNLTQFVSRLLEAVKAPPIRALLPVRVGRAVASVSEWLWNSFSLGGEPPLTSFTVHQISTSHWPNIVKAKKLLGYAPKVSVEEGLARLAEAAREGYLQPPKG
jgi:nucleoside-diphosphate-sugar epimerase